MTRINTNVSSLVAQKTLSRSNNDLQTALTRLSTGLRINKGKDDPAGLIASEILRSDIVATQRAVTNSERANQIIATADSALGQVSTLLNDIRGLVSESANSGALSDEQIAANQLQVDSSLEAIDRIAQTTSFQGRRLLDGSLDFLAQNIGSANVRAAGTFGSVAGAAATGSFGTVADANATLVLSGTDTAPGVVTFNATSAGTGLNGIEVKYVFNSTQSLTATFSSNVLTITLSGGVAASDVVTKVNSLTGTTQLSASVTTAGNIFSAATTGAVTKSGSTASGAFTNAISLSAVNNGASYNATVALTVSDAAARAAYNTATNTLTLSVSAAATTSALVSAINAGGVFQASAQSASGGVYTAFTSANATAGGLDSNTLILSASIGGPTYNGLSVAVATSDGAARSSYDTGTNTLTINRSAAATAASVIDSINATGIFSATASGNGLGILTAGTTANVTTGGSSGSIALSDLKIDQANFGTATSISVDVRVDRQATTGELYYSAGTLSSDLVLQLGGKSGFETFNFGTGSTIQQIRDAVNLVSDATGVSASVASGATSGSYLKLSSVEFGSDAFVSAKALSGTFNAVNLSGTASERASGQDVAVRINGVQAQGKGLQASLNTSTLDLSFTVNRALVDGDQFGFQIAGGGANFQIGPDVVSNQQARLGIQGVSTATLGGVSGKLYELRSGGASDLKTDTKAAARIVDEVIAGLTSLRGRLGAFQKTTLETNIATLNDTLENLTEAESSIRDADFAAESARLTRAQILVQSGTSVLSIANQNPQNVLSLLR